MKTNDELNKIIAKWCGWHTILDDEYGPLRGCKPGEVVTPGFIFTDIPNYCTDLNAIHEAVKKLPEGPFTWWSNHLMQIVGTHLKSINAGARERAEALVAVIEGENKTKVNCCPRCSAVGIIKRHHEGGFATPECYWKECETCNYEWDHS